MSNPDDAQYMRLLIQKAQELVNSGNEAPKKVKAKRNISDERKEELRQRMIALREKSIVSRQAKAKSKTQPKEEAKTEPKQEVKPVEVKPEVKQEVKVAPTPAPVIHTPAVPEKVYPKYFLPTMNYAKRHGFAFGNI